MNLVCFRFETDPKTGQPRIVLVDAGMHEHQVDDPNQLWQAMEAIDADPELAAAREDAAQQTAAGAAGVAAGGLKSTAHEMGCDAVQGYATDLLGDAAGRVAGRVARDKGQGILAMLRMISRKPGRAY